MGSWQKTSTAMADVSFSGNRRSTRVDMTPMVDLGFLLITFFILTTTLQKPVVLEMGMPARDAAPPPPVKCSQTLTVFLDKNGGLFYQPCAEFMGKKPPLRTDFSAQGLRRILLENKARVGEKFTVLVKATDQSSYGHLVDVLDELAITDCRRYALVEITDADRRLLAQPKR
jgi:biopolymer transport protein ExbD